MTRRIENSIEVPGTPEEVWEAIATSHGIECWFVPARVDDGRVALDAEIRVGDRAAFADELTRAVTQVVADHHTTEGEPYRLLVAAHPREDA